MEGRNNTEIAGGHVDDFKDRAVIAHDGTHLSIDVGVHEAVLAQQLREKALGEIFGVGGLTSSAAD